MRSLLVFFGLMMHLWCLGQNHTTILSDKGSYTLNFEDLNNILWQFDRHYKIAIRQEEDVELLRNITLEVKNFNDEKLTSASIIVRHQDGSQETLPRDSFKVSPFDADYTEYIGTLQNLSVGDTLEVQYRTLSLPSTEIYRWEIQHRYPVDSSVVEFLLPVSATYYDHLTDSRYLAKEEALSSRLRLSRGTIPLKGLRVHFADIPPLPNEVLGPEGDHVKPALLFQIAKLYLNNKDLYMPEWSDQILDLSVHEYFGQQYRVRSNYRWMLEKGLDIINTRYTDSLHILKLYEFVHKELEWDGTYGLFPSHSLQEMSDIKSVNKSAINMALLAMISEAGYSAYPILIPTSDRAKIYRQIPNINQFNHFVIAVEFDNGVILVDGGDPNLPIGLIDSGLNPETVIAIKNYKGHWQSISALSAASKIIVNLRILADLSAQGSIECLFEGYDGFNERHLLAGDPKATYWKDRGVSLNPRIRIDSVRFDNVKNLLLPFKNRVYFHIQPSPDQAELAFIPVFYSFFNQPYFSDTSRVSDIFFPSLLREYCVMNVHFDESLEVKSMPSPQKLRTDNGRIKMEYLSSQKINAIAITFDISTSSSRFPVEEYSGVRVILERTLQKLMEQVVIGKKS